MSENLHNIDDLFKRAIEEHTDTPSQQVWDAIDKNLDKKKVVSISRKYNKLKWAAAVLLLFSTGMAMYVWQTSMKNKQLVKQKNINKTSKSKTEIKINDEKKSTNTELIAPSKNNNEQKNEKINSGYGTKTDKKLQPSPEQKGITQPQNKTEQQFIANQNQQLPPVTENKNKEGVEKNIRARIPEKREIENSGNDIFKKLISEVPMILNRQPQLNHLEHIQLSNPFPFNPKGESTDKGIVTQNTRDTPAKKSKMKSTKASPFSATIFYSPEFVSSKVKIDRPRYREDDRRDIKNNEKIRSSSSYGILLGYNIGNNWQVQSGISISTRVTDINTKTIYARPDRRGNVNYTISCSAGSAYIPSQSGNRPAQGDSTRILSAKNTLQYVSVPIGVKYNIGKGKFKLLPGAGISANILSKGKVETVIATGSGNENSSTNNIEGLKPVYFNSQFSLGAEYPLSQKVSLNFTPSAKLALSSINKDAAVKTKLNSFGLAAGITIKF